MADISKIISNLMIMIAVTLSTFEFTNGFMPCIKSDPKLGECLKTSLQNVLPNLGNGVPSLGLPSIDPFRITSLQIDQGDGPVSIKLNFRDLDVTNLGTMEIDEVNADIHNKNISLDVYFEKPITLDGNYDIKGQVMALPIIGDGKCKIILDNVKAKINAHLKSVERNEKKYVEVQELSLNFTTSRMHIKLDNLFNGDKALGNNMNEFLNENWKAILGELQSSIENALTALVSEVAKKVLSRVPLNHAIKD